MKKAAKIAFCSVTGSLILLLMFLGNIIPVATYAVPCIASILMSVAMQECTEKYAWILFFSVSALSIIITFDKELMLFYILLLGYYPMVKRHIDNLKSPVVKAALKLIIFNAALAAIYALLLIVFPISDLINEFKEIGMAITAVLVILGNITFFLLDIAIDRAMVFYRLKLRPKLVKSLRS